MNIGKDEMDQRVARALIDLGNVIGPVALLHRLCGLMEREGFTVLYEEGESPNVEWYRHGEVVVSFFNDEARQLLAEAHLLAEGIEKKAGTLPTLRDCLMGACAARSLRIADTKPEGKPGLLDGVR